MQNTDYLHIRLSPAVWLTELTVTLQICEHVDRRDFYFDSRYRFRSLDLVPSHKRGSTRDLANLRLASRTTCAGANPHFFQHVDARFPHRKGTSVAHWRRSLLDFCSRPWVKHVQTINIGSGEEYWGHELPKASREAFLTACAYAIPAFVRTCTSLRAVRCYVGPDDMGFNTNNEPSWQRHLFLLTIENILRECPQTLENLQLSLPLTSDFGALHDSISKAPALVARLSRLRSMSVRINDSTGIGGVRYWTIAESDGHRRFPNQQHQGGLWSLVKLASAPDALSVCCTHLLNFDHLSTAQYEALHELKLISVAISGNRLIKMARHKASCLRAIEMMVVELNSNTWGEVLNAFCELPDLINFYIDSCGYSATGSSSNCRPGLLPEIDNPQPIETYHSSEDYCGLGAVQRHVNGLRAAKGLELYGDHEYRHMGYLQ